MGKPAARIGDMHTCPMVTALVPHVGGPILPPCAPTVLTGGIPQARVTDLCVCVGPPDMIAMGSPNVLVSGLMAARMGDNTIHGGIIGMGLPTVLIGEQGGKGGGGGGPPAKPGMGNGDGAVGETDMGTTDIAPMLATGATIAAPAEQAAANKAAAEARVPFCARCEAERQERGGTA